MSGNLYNLKINRSNATAVDEYLEYRRIVGDDDSGKLMTPDEYEQYKKTVIPMRIKNRLYVSWCSPTEMDCKLVGPETQCFCKHRYKQHKTDLEVIPKERPILLPCRVSGCKCISYQYVPLNGSQPIRCSCKHTADEHAEFKPFVCKRGGCIKCTGFSSPFTCGCGSPVKHHKMVVETADEREKRGHPLGEVTPYAAMGGVTGFSSLAEGYMRLDPSGRGAPPKGVQSQSITSGDDPFLRANVHAIKQHQMRKKDGVLSGPGDDVFDDIAERVSSMRRPGESDMEFFERRYQERSKASQPQHGIARKSVGERLGARNPAKK